MKRIALLLTAAAVLTTAAVWAENPAPAAKGKGGPGRMGNMALLPPRALEELKLTPEQKTKVDALEAKYDKERDEWKANHLEENTKLQEQLKAANEAKDQTKVKEIRAKLKEANAPMMEVRKKYMDQVRAVLTDEQKQTLDGMQAKMRERAKEHGAGAPAAK